jgi:hypothetical protein
MSLPNNVIAAFRAAGDTLEHCSRINYVSLFNRFIDFMTSMNASRTLSEMRKTRSLNSNYDTTYATNLAMLYESVNTEIEDGRLSLTYKSFFNTSRSKVNWFPLMQAFYDLNDETYGITRTHEVPEHILIKGLFQLIWNGSIDYYDNTDYPSQEEVVKYIKDNTKCPISNDFKVIPSHFRVPDDIMISKDYHPRVYLFAPDYSKINDYTGNPTKYNPSNVIDGRLNRRYHREVGSPPPIEKVHGKIIKRFSDVSDLRSLRTLRQSIIPQVEVELDDGRQFPYHISELYLARDQPRRQVKQSIFQRPKSRSRSRDRKHSNPPAYSEVVSNYGNSRGRKTRVQSRLGSKSPPTSSRKSGTLEHYGFKPRDPRRSHSGGKKRTIKNNKQ